MACFAAMSFDHRIDYIFTLTFEGLGTSNGACRPTDFIAIACALDGLS